MDDIKWAMAREIPHLRRYARALLRDADAADDLVQDCLERALQKRHLWQRKGSLRSWLFRILYTRFLDGRAKRARVPGTASLDAVGEPVGQPAAQLDHAAAVEVMDALFTIDQDQRAALLLIAVEGMAYDEAASVLDIPIGTLRSRLWRGREALKADRPGRPGRPGRNRPSLRRVK